MRGATVSQVDHRGVVIVFEYVEWPVEKPIVLHLFEVLHAMQGACKERLFGCSGFRLCMVPVSGTRNEEGEGKIENTRRFSYSIGGLATD